MNGDGIPLTPASVLYYRVKAYSPDYDRVFASEEGALLLYYRSIRIEKAFGHATTALSA
jgi:hypothetical protein